MKLILTSILKSAADLPKGMSVQELHSIAKNPGVQSYVNELQYRKNTRNASRSWKMPATAAGLGAAGYGMKRLGDAALTPDDRHALDSFAALSDKVKASLTPVTSNDVIHHPVDTLFHGINPNSVSSVDTNPDYKDSSDLFWDYNDKASRAVASKLYGKDGLPVIHKIKSMLGLSDAPVRLDSPARDIEGENHYPAFQHGPFSAYVHQMGKEFADTPIYSQPNVFFKYPNDVDKSKYLKLTPEQESAVNHQFQPGYNTKSLDTTPGGQFRDNWLSHLNSYLKNKGYGPVAVTPSGYQTPKDVLSLNHAQQQNLAREFAPSFSTADPSFYNKHEAYLKNFSDWQKRPIVNYGNAIRTGATLLQDIPRAAGKGMMVAGGGLALYWLLKKLQHKQQESTRPRDVLQNQAPIKQLP